MTPPRIAVCDDHRLFGDSLAVILRSEGCSVVSVTGNPEELLDVLRTAQVDVCVLDLHFGPAHGTRTDAIAAVTDVSPDTKVVVLTGDERRSAMPAAVRAGAAAFVHKTDGVDAIVGAVHGAHRGAGHGHGQSSGLRVRHPRRSRAEQLADSLTPRELEILAGLVRGEDNRTLARQLGIAYSTARSHVQNVLMKLGAHSQTEAAVIAVRYRLVDPAVRAHPHGTRVSPKR